MNDKANITELSDVFTAIKEYMTDEQVEFVRTAYELAEKAHTGQTRLSGEPYIIHPICVAGILANLQMDDKCLAAAFLHDVVEDTSYSNDDIKAKFGDEVARLVDGVTKLGKLEYVSNEEQQLENYRKMFLAMAKDIRVVIVKLADRLHNMRTMKYLPVSKQQRISKETLEIYAPLANRLGIHTIKWQLEDLAFRYNQPEVYAELQKSVHIKRLERETMVNDAIAIMKSKLAEANIECEIQGRPKNFYSIHKKMLRDHKQIGEIYDLLAIRVLVKTVQDCYGTLGIVHSIWRPIPGRIKDYIAVPKSNGYQSLHTTVLSTGGQPLEIQIRTYEMHHVSEYGVAAHWRYKKQGNSEPGKDTKFDAKLNWLRQLLDWHEEVNNANEFVNTIKTDIFGDEVFVFTPRGDVIDLPQGSVPIDFAYRVHTDVGNRCVGAKINGRIVTLDTKLKNGDIVEVVTSKTSTGPSRDWMKICGSNDTRNKIRNWFKKERREENIIKGREMFEEEVKHLGYDIKTFASHDKLEKIYLRMRIESEENMYAAIGYGGITLNSVIAKLVEQYKKEQQQNNPQNLAQLLKTLKPRASKSAASHGILVGGEGGLMVKLARCCNPIPGDEIVGYITRGSGVSVHRADCVHVMAYNPNEQKRMIDVKWDISLDNLYKVDVIIVSEDRPGMMGDIMTVITDVKLNLFEVNSRVDNATKTATTTLGIDITAAEQLEYVMNRLRRMKGVFSVERAIASVGGQHK
ncbi:MAG: bifunctional (p)ppGpp synthetase/guanosine-3',5'-bis(diphosphate) 3'-pyrophosphohydrolase [Phascolarctobacterium sp.]|nr:bifunctional (p)ppGpp synthetase/guanosine-3',5'-bis(diphosphate) 3'-pyrophosphohydrolase [Candidatus Phascolarctobacterium caballi]